MTNGKAVLTAASVGLNTNGIISSCLDFLKNADKLAVTYGKAMGGAGVVLSGYQTFIGLSDGEFTHTDMLNILSLSLGIAALVATGPVAGALGIGACVIGLISTFTSQQTIFEIELENGQMVYLYFG